ncbi:MAG: hypothetical protein APF77_23345 [Clostridia bacterium BRH_c25]|nr:MAG: hypothetical protein APF77_23345 [Clostridia bacterium BRH_c25]
MINWIHVKYLHKIIRISGIAYTRRNLNFNNNIFLSMYIGTLYIEEYSILGYMKAPQYILLYYIRKNYI